MRSLKVATTNAHDKHDAELMGVTTRRALLSQQQSRPSFRTGSSTSSKNEDKPDENENSGENTTTTTKTTTIITTIVTPSPVGNSNNSNGGSRNAKVNTTVIIEKTTNTTTNDGSISLDTSAGHDGKAIIIVNSDLCVLYVRFGWSVADEVYPLCCCILSHRPASECRDDRGHHARRCRSDHATGISGR